MKSPEYYRGVQAAFEWAHAGSKWQDMPEAGTSDEFDAGWNAQVNAWPVVLDLPPAEYHRPDGGLAQGLFFSVSLMCFFALIVAFPKLSGPAAGALLIVTVISGVAAYRNRK